MLQSDLDNILAAITAGKKSAHELKSSFDWQAFQLDVNNYLQNVSQENWRSTFVPLIEGVMTEQGSQMIASFGLKFDVPNVPAMQWFDEYTLKFAQEINATTTAGVGDLIQLAQYEGWSTTQMQDRIGLMFKQWREGTTNPDEWDWYDERMPTYRLNTIARTETMRSSNYGSFKIMDGWGVQKKEWLATYDKATRKTHIDAWLKYGGRKNAIPMHEHFNVGGKFLMQPGDPNGGGEGINCFIPTTSVEGQFNSALKVWYSGAVREVKTRRGYCLTITPNHAILTRRGWIRANELIKGDYLLSNRDDVGSVMGWNVDNQNPPTRIDQIFNAFAANGRGRLIVPTAHDFDGDARFMNGEINVVSVNRELPFNRNIESRFDDAFEFQFISSGDLAGILIDGYSPSDFTLNRVFRTTSLIPGITQLSSNEIGIDFETSPFDKFLFGAASQWNTTLGKKSRDDVATATEFIGELINASAGQIGFDELIGIRDYEFCGHVYDLQAIDGWILAENIICSNCRCTLIPSVDSALENIPKDPNE